LGLFRLVPAGCQGFLGTFSDQTAHAGAGGDKANGELLGLQMKIVATDATMVVLKDAGHWVLEEKPNETTDALMKFL
jgi:pimeloyl-ACP methyl ester carboxylesterase